MTEDLSEYEIVAKAIEKCKEEYYKVIEEHGIDSSYFPIYELKVLFLHSDCESFSRIIIDRDTSTKGKEFDLK